MPLKRAKAGKKQISDNIRRLSEYIAVVEKQTTSGSLDLEQTENTISEDTSLDDYTRLSDYMADVSGQKLGKLHSLWIENCEAGDSIEFLDMAITEIKETQEQNSRAKNKTYHMLVSFQEEDGIPDETILREMEKAYAEALGFSEHQRIVACHQDRDNFHFHVAYNRVHPESHKCHSPSWDYYKRDKVNREMEKKYGLSVDKGVSDKDKQTEKDKKPEGATDMEAHRWEESFDSYVRKYKEELKVIVKEANSWEDVHKGFAEYDLELKKHANGLVIVSRGKKKQQVKASSINRGFSKARLEGRFGAFQSPDNGNKKKGGERDSYKTKPITKHPKQEKLWGQYRADRKAWHKGWKAFLFQLALVQDPLAIAIIQAQRMLIRAIIPRAEQNVRMYSTSRQSKDRKSNQKDSRPSRNKEL